MIDGLVFAKAEGRLAGTVQVAKLPRLAQDLADNRGQLDWQAAGNQDQDGKCWLSLSVSGTLTVICQRCLDRLELPVEIGTRLLLVPPGQSWPDDELAEDGFDAVAAEKEMVLSSLIEDEVLLALPVAPRHEVCVTPTPVVAEHEPSPFAALAKLKRGV
ncbi:MAG: YceD family protein [Zoogloeaceae bacterium]|nr:YceD family protein [Zoogloeaceae bacterium]